MTEPETPQDAADALYNRLYGAASRPPLSDEDETLYATFYGSPGRTPLTDEEQQIYNSLNPEN